MKLNITGYSTALFSTWYFVEEWGILLDAGEGLTSALLQKAGKITHVFVSHADRDHFTGLLQFNQLNARKGLPKIFYPKDCGSFPALEAFTKKFDPHVSGTEWSGITAGESVQVKDGLFVQPIRNEHVQCDSGVHKSFGYQVYEVKHKLKQEYTNLSGEEIRQLKEKIGKENLTDAVRTNLLTYSGDTPVDDYEKWNHTKVLIHEATFLGKTEQASLNIHGNKHSNLEEVMQMVSQLDTETLILGHFSSRYSNEEMDKKIKSLCKMYHIKIPVYRILPGQLHRNILSEEPVN